MPTFLRFLRNVDLSFGKKYSGSILICIKYCKKKYNSISKYSDESMITLINKNEIKRISQFLRSDIALDIILLSDRTKNTTDIAKILNKSIPTISTYANKLRKNGLLKDEENNMLPRATKGLKINFGIGVE
jgi:hypothetical protein